MSSPAAVPPEISAQPRELSIMDSSGDTTIGWSEDQDDIMRAFIEKKMADGWSFFLLKPRLGGYLPPRRMKLTRLADLAADDRAISVTDADFRQLLEAGIGIGKRMPGMIETDGRAATADAVLKSPRTLAIKPKKGG
jgi:hypothetical protein